MIEIEKNTHRKSDCQLAKPKVISDPNPIIDIVGVFCEFSTRLEITRIK